LEVKRLADVPADNAPKSDSWEPSSQSPLTSMDKECVSPLGTETAEPFNLP